MDVPAFPAQRDPISGRGNFGDREWDPIGRYNGKTRRAKSSTGKHLYMRIFTFMNDLVLFTHFHTFSPVYDEFPF
ncbi:unnamed protein product [Trichobilharzia regenti]|nr:unnamed protein product [Trichobilharzia regenti]